MARSSGIVYRALSARLLERRAELEQDVLNRIHAIPGVASTDEPEYEQRLRIAVSAAVGYGFSGIAQYETAGSQAVPPVLLVQAKLAARSGVSLDTVLRRYVAGYALLSDLLLELVEREGLIGEGQLQRLLRSQANLFDRLLERLSEEYAHEAECCRVHSSDQKRLDSVNRLLGGELIDATQLSYDLEQWHLGLVVNGDAGSEIVQELAREFDCRLLLISPDDRAAWAWLGSQRRPDAGRIGAFLKAHLSAGGSVAMGEVAAGKTGWRLTHRQARAAWPIAQRKQAPAVQYGDVAVLASMLRDDLLVSSLHEIFVAPISVESTGGEALRDTLRAYFAANRNISSAAALLNVNRNTVARRLQAIEDRIGRPVSECAVELELAMMLEQEREAARPEPLATVATR